MRLPRPVVLTLASCVLGVPALAQSPNTAAIVVVVVDQAGLVVPGASVSIANTQTGATTRDVVTGADGSVTVPALSLAGVYKATVKMEGFADEVLTDLALRGGETATLRVTLKATGGQSEVTVYGTTQGVRADPELGTRLDAARIDETPVLGRKMSSLPLLNAAFRPAQATGDLFMNSVYFVTGAGGRREPDYVVDGATGNEASARQTMYTTLPIGAIQEMNVQARAFSAEFGWTSMTAVDIVTKAGTNQLRGEVLLLGRPGGLQPSTMGTANQCAPSISTCVAPTTSTGASVELVPPDVPDSLGQGSFAIGGAFVQDKTHFFLAADWTKQKRTAALTSPIVVPPGQTSVGYIGDYQQVLGNGRLDQSISQGHSLMARVNVDRFYDTNPQDTVSGVVLPSAARKFQRHAYSLQANETSVLSNSMLNEARVVFLNADPVSSFDPVTPSTSIMRAGSAPFTVGESRFSHIRSRETDFSDTLSWTRAAHYLRLGGNAGYHTSGGDNTEFGSAYIQGQYTANPATTVAPDQLTLANMARYQQSFNFGQNTYVLNQWLFSAFAQDSYRARSDLTLDLGLRYDRETFNQGKKNFAPRLGFGWHPGGSATTAIRGGYGVYYTYLRGNYDAAFTYGGPLGTFTYIATPGQTGFPSCLTCTPVPFDANAAARTLPARNITIEPGMAAYYTSLGINVAALPGYAAATFVNPKSQVTSVGIERQLARGLFVSADYVHQRWTGLDETVDMNAPTLLVRTVPGTVRSAAAADLTRPIVPVNGGYRVINVVENQGVADYDGVSGNLRWTSDKAFASVSYTLSKATNTTEPNGNGAGPNDFNQLGPADETAPSFLDQRHRAVIMFSYRLPYNLTAGTVSQLASARPFNATTGVDDNGDSNTNDRPVINGQVVSRYAFRGTPIYETAVYLEDRIPMSRRAFVLRVECFNLFNHANILNRNGTYGDGATPLATFGQALTGLTNLMPGRMVQLQARFAF
jgi:hypothetical protein